jgi:hypothetical protein
MGMYTRVEVQLSLHKDDFEKTCEIIDNFIEGIEEHIQKGMPFSANKPHITHGDEDYGFLELIVESERTANAYWQTNCLIKLLQINNIRVNTFNAEETIPQTFLHIGEEDDFNEYEPNLK